MSYWGPIPAAPDSADSSHTTFRDAPRPIWEGIFYWPFRIAGEPLVLAADGVGATAAFLDERKVLQRAARLLVPRAGPFGVLIGVEAGGLAGLGGGLTLEHDRFLRPGNNLRIGGGATVKGDLHAILGLRVPFQPGSYFEMGTGYRRRNNVRYFGIGPWTREQDEAFYHQEMFWAGTALRRQVMPHLYAEGSLLYSSVSAGEPRKDAPSMSTVFAGRLPEGFGLHSSGVSFGLQLTHENEAGQGRVTRGGIRRVRVERFEGTDDTTVAFWSYRGEVQQFLTLWHPYRILALRGYAAWLDPAGPGAIPFTRLLVNQTPDELRGFRSFRFRDRGLIALNADYRFPLWTNARPGGGGLDLCPLADWGQVFQDAGQIGARRMTFSYGLGLRLESGHGFIARVDWARSKEGNVITLGATQIFQFTGPEFLHGHDPIPAR